MEDHGTKTENYVDLLCQKMFLRDFTVRSPMYLKKEQEKEVSDILVLFNGTLLNFQVKSKIETKYFSCKEEKDINRIKRKINDAVAQFKTLNEAHKSNSLDELKTLPDHLREKIILMHYGDNWRDFELEALDAGFHSWAKVKHSYTFARRAACRKR